MLLLFSVFLIVAGKVGVDFIISDIFKACVLELGFISEGIVAVAVIFSVHAGEVEGIHRVLVFLEFDLVAVAVKDLNKADQEALKKIPGVLSVTPAA